SVIIALAAVWYFTSGVDPDKCGSGDSCLLGPRYSEPADPATTNFVPGPGCQEPADPATTNFVPRPDWYFYFLFYLLRIFKWPDSVILGTIGIPTIALVIALPIPSIDLRRERQLLRRPIAIVAAVLVALSMGVLTYKGATAKEALGSELLADVPNWVKSEKLPANAVPGARLFATSGCLNCHT